MHIESHMKTSSYFKHNLIFFHNQKHPYDFWIIFGHCRLKTRKSFLGLWGRQGKVFLIKDVSGFWYFSCYVSVALLPSLGPKINRAELWAVLLAHAFLAGGETWQNCLGWKSFNLKPKPRAEGFSEHPHRRWAKNTPSLLCSFSWTSWDKPVLLNTNSIN